MNSFSNFCEAHPFIFLGFVLLTRAVVENILGITPVSGEEVNLWAANLFFGDVPYQTPGP